MNKGDLTLVTGVSGYLAFWLAKNLLVQRYRVRGTLRNLEDAGRVKTLRSLFPGVELVAADLRREEGWSLGFKSFTNAAHAQADVDPQETCEWLDALGGVLAAEGRPRAHYLIDRLVDLDLTRHGDLHGRVTTPYVNTITVDRQPLYPGDLAIEHLLL